MHLEVSPGLNGVGCGVVPAIPKDRWPVTLKARWCALGAGGVAARGGCIIRARFLDCIIRARFLDRIREAYQALQGQRDFFGAHTYRRVDRPGSFHTRWSEDGQEVEV